MQASQEGVSINGNMFVELFQKVKGWFLKNASHPSLLKSM